MSLLGTCFLDNSGIAVDCRSIPARTALPTVQQYGNYSVEAVTGWLILDGQAITEIPAGGFDACPYTAATTLDLNYNNIKTVGARAFGRLAALTYLSLARNGITWMAPTSLDGLPLLEELYLNGNRLGAFDYGALVPMDFLQRLYLNNQEGGDLSCGGKDLWTDDLTGIAAAVALCGAAGSPCVDEAVACPAVAAITTVAFGQHTCTTIITDLWCGWAGQASGNIAGISIDPLVLTALPTVYQWGSAGYYPITTVYLRNQLITNIPDHGFDACPHNETTTLQLFDNRITRVGAEAFAHLSALTELLLDQNDITWMAASSLDGLINLEKLTLHNNRLQSFHYGALALMFNLRWLNLGSQIDNEGNIDGYLGCDGTDRWWPNGAGIRNAAASCRGACYYEAVGCRTCSMRAEPTHAETSNTIDSMFGYHPVRYDVEFDDAVAAGYSRVFVVHGHTFYMQEDDTSQSYGTHVLDCTDCTQGECAYARHVYVPGSHVPPNSFRECKYLETVSMEGNEICDNSFVGNTRLHSVTSAQPV